MAIYMGIEQFNVLDILLRSESAIGSTMVKILALTWLILTMVENAILRLVFVNTFCNKAKLLILLVQFTEILQKLC